MHNDPERQRPGLAAIAITARLLLLAAVLGASLGACSSNGGAPTGTLIVGLTSDYRAGVDISRLEVQMSVDGVVVDDRSLELGGARPEVELPAELPFTDVADGSALTLLVRGYDDNDVLRVARRVDTLAVGGSPRLLRVHLQASCRLIPPAPGAPPGAPTCDEASQTCISGTCRSSFVSPASFEPYASDWSESFGDVCKPLGAGEAVVRVGRGQADYLPMDDDEVAEVEAGPQGGHHIWVAARIKNLHQAGSITTVSGEIPALGLSLSPLKVIFTFDPDEGGFCKIYGLRYQIDIDGDDIDTLLGHRMKVSVSIRDIRGDVGVGERWVHLSDDILRP